MATHPDIHLGNFQQDPHQIFTWQYPLTHYDQVAILDQLDKMSKHIIFLTYAEKSKLTKT